MGVGEGVHVGRGVAVHVQVGSVQVAVGVIELLTAPSVSRNLFFVSGWRLGNGGIAGPPLTGFDGRAMAGLWTGCSFRPSLLFRAADSRALLSSALAFVAGPSSLILSATPLGSGLPGAVCFTVPDKSPSGTTARMPYSNSFSNPLIANSSLDLRH